MEMRSLVMDFFVRQKRRDCHGLLAPDNPQTSGLKLVDQYITATNASFAAGASTRLAATEHSQEWLCHLGTLACFSASADSKGTLSLIITYVLILLDLGSIFLQVLILRGLFTATARSIFQEPQS